MTTPTNLAPHQHRVVVEATLLGDNLKKLNDFFSTPIFAKLDQAERNRLIAQAGFMKQYHDVLEERITAFVVEC